MSTFPVQKHHAPLPIREAFQRGWELTKQHFALMAGVLLFMFLLRLFFDQVIQSVEEQTTLLFVAGLIAICVMILVDLGAIALVLKLFDGKGGAWTDLFSQPHLVFRYVGAGILYGLGVAVGLVLLIVPGIIVALRGQFFSYFLVDKNAGVIQSLKQSFAVTREYSWELLGFWLLLILINVAGALLLGVGLLVSVPVSMFATVHLYRFLIQRLVPPIEAEVKPEPIKIAETNGGTVGVMNSAKSTEGKE